jgi:predicted glycosyltransferase
VDTGNKGEHGRKSTPLRILNYAINGLGLGHLTRLIAINRQIRRLSTLLGSAPAEITFLTSSEADNLAFAHHFATFKIPAKGIVASCGLDAARYRKISKQWVWNAINLISPDLLIVDTFPMGSFNELYDVLDFGQKNVFIYRAVRPEAANQPAFQSALRGYHQILLPQEQGENASPIPESLRDRVVPVGEILLRSASETLPRDIARAELGLPTEGSVVYLSTGGGGDVASEKIFAACIAMAGQLPDVRFVIGAGPLYRGREFTAPNVTWSYRLTMMEYFPAFDVALTAGGFNSVNELMHCGVPCVFLPQPRSHDDQEQRVARCVAAGAGTLLSTVETDEMTLAITQLLKPAVRAGASLAAQHLVPINHAPHAAAEILSLFFSEEQMEQAILLCDATLLREAHSVGIEEATFLGATRLLLRKLSAPLDAATADELLAATLRYLTVSKELGIPPGKALSVLRSVPEETAIENVIDAALKSLGTELA